MKFGSILGVLVVLIVLSSVLGVLVTNIYGSLDFTLPNDLGGSSGTEQDGNIENSGTETVSPTGVTLPEEILF